MNQLKNPTVSNKTDPTEIEQPNRVAPVLVTLGSMSILAVWFVLDNSWPFWDSASHVFDAIGYKELYQHAHPLSPQWWHSLLTVNYCYPPQIHAWNGLVKLMFPTGLMSDQVSLVIFCGILCLSTYHIALKLFKTTSAAVLSVIAINCFPIVTGLSHLPLLDYPHLALYSLSMLLLLNWNEFPNLKNGILLGIGLGLAVCAKQVAAFFLFVPCLYSLAKSILERDFNKIRSIVTAGLIACSFVLVWIIPNYNQMRAYTERNELASQAGSYISYVFEHIVTCLNFIPGNASPFLFLIFLATLLFSGIKLIKKTGLFFLSAATGILILSSLPFQHPEQRYIIPVYLFIALIAGYGLSKGFSSDKIWLKTSAIASILVCCLQAASFNFAPYPIPIQPVHAYLGVESEDFGYHFEHVNPTPPTDPWSQRWVIEKISETGGTNSGYLYVLPNSPKFNVHTLNLIAKTLNCPIKATTTRKFTMTGETTGFLEKEIFYYDWFLLLESMPLEVDGTHMTPKDQSSLKALESIENFVKKSQRFSLVGKRKLPDGNTLLLYRKNVPDLKNSE